jgi:hypothetical protein
MPFKAPGLELLATQAARLGFAQCLSCRLVTGLLASMNATSAEAPRTGCCPAGLHLASDEQT